MSSINYPPPQIIHLLKFYPQIFSHSFQPHPLVIANHFISLCPFLWFGNNKVQETLGARSFPGLIIFEFECPLSHYVEEHSVFCVCVNFHSSIWLEDWMTVHSTQPHRQGWQPRILDELQFAYNKKIWILFVYFLYFLRQTKIWMKKKREI